MGSHMMPGRERWRATRRSIRFTMAAIMAVPIAAVIVMWGLAGFTISDAIAGHSPNTQHGTVLIRIALAATIGLIAILIAAIVMGWFSRRLARDVASLESAARRFADQQLPQLVERLRRGDQVELEDELPPAPQAKITEIGRAAAALASVQRTAVTAAITETSVRSGISQVFVSLARRSQSLLQRQLRLLDDLERKAADPGALADLFPLDHLTTRMRRHAEGLIILSGAVPGRAWSSPVPVIDVIRGAIAEVEDYKRIAVVSNAEDMVAGSAVADMIHLLAELIENAALFSPSGTRVEVRAERVGNGFAFEIEDRGLGIKPEELDAINQQLSSPTDFDLANADQLGLFVVSRLAARHGLRVFLRPSPYGGTTAIVVLPRSMITSEAEAPPAAQLADRAAGPGRADELQLSLTGRRIPRAMEAGSAAGALAAGPTAGPDAAAGPSLDSGPDTGPDLAPRRALPAALTESDTAATRPVLPSRRATHKPAGGSSEPDTSPGQPVFPERKRADSAAGTHLGLPRRVRQANLSPHLRNTSPTAGPAPSRDLEARSPEQAKSLLASLQSGWERGRQADVPDSEATTGERDQRDEREPSDGAREGTQEA
jgi:signal transduction histidine kinase